MGPDLEKLNNLLGLMVPMIGFTVWLIRLEGKAEHNREMIRLVDSKYGASIDKLEVKHEALDNKIVNKLSQIEKSLAKIEGRLSIENEAKS